MRSSLAVNSAPLAAGLHPASVTIQYKLTDPDSNPINIVVWYSADGGKSFLPASMAAALTGDGLSNLSSSPGGQNHTFVWDAAKDLDHSSGPDVLVRVDGTDTVSGATGTSTTFPFDVGHPPRVYISSPRYGFQRSPVTINYSLTDAASEPIRIEVSFSTDAGQHYQAATEIAGPASDGTANLTSTPPGRFLHKFIWDAATDLHGASASVLIQIATFDPDPGHIGSAGPFTVNTPPNVRITNITPGTWPAPVTVDYQLSDAESELCRIEVSYSTDLGKTFQAATMASTPAGDGLTNLASSPAGVAHTYQWDAVTDLHGAVAVVAMLRIASFDSQPGATDSSAPMRIGAPLASTSTLTSPASEVPSIEVLTPPDNIGPQVPVHFVVGAPNSQPLDVTVQYSAAGGGFHTATAASTSDHMTGIPAPAVMADYRFVWDAQADQVPKGDATLRLTASRGALASTPAVIAVQVDAASVTPPTEYLDDLLYKHVKIELAPGTTSEQTGISGQFLPNSLGVHVFDSIDGDIAGARVSYIATQGADLFAIDTHLYSQTTGRSGLVSARVRALPGKTGNGTVEARIVGMPSLKAVFTFSIKMPRIVAISGYGTAWSPASPLTPLLGESPSVGTLSIYYNGDSNVYQNSGFWWEPQRPVRLLVEASGVSAPSEIIAGGIVPGCPRRGVAGTLTFRHPTDTTVAAVTVSVPALPALTGPFRHTGGNPMTWQLGPDLGMQFRPVDSASGDPVGISGRTLTSSLRLQLKDNTGQVYGLQVAQADAFVQGPDSPQFDVPPATQAQTVRYQVVGGGLLSKTQLPGTLNDLTAEITEDVYFTPLGAPPWRVYATVSGPVFDGASPQSPTSQKVNWRWSDVFPAGDPTLMAARGWALDPGGENDHCFFVNPPTAKFLVSGTTDVVTEAKPGERVVLQVKASPTVAGTATVTLEALNAGPNNIVGYAPTAYAGMKRPWSQAITLQAAADGTLTSDEILMVAGDPEISKPAPVIQSVIPGGWLHAYSDCFETWIAITPRQVKRRIVNGDESVFESPVGTSPRGGLAGTVLLHNGEFQYDVTDLSFATATGLVALTRRYRSHNISPDGPMGPGWTFGIVPSLDVSTDLSPARWFDGAGRWDDYFTGSASGFSSAVAPRGSLVMLTGDAMIDADHSAYRLYDAHGNEVHFQVDGTIRFFKDRQGAKTTYTFDENGRLTKITDAHSRDLTLTYDNNGKLTHARGLSENQQTDFTYYPKSDPAAGWLWKVTYPATDTFFQVAQPGADPAADYRRSETYTYQISSSNPKDGYLLTIADSENNTIITNSYVQDRVQSQQTGATSFVFDYSIALTTKVTDREKHTVDYIFPADVYPVCATPVTYHDAKTNPWTLVHNGDGRLIQVTSPRGDKVEYVYDYLGFGLLGHDILSFPFPRGNMLKLRRTSSSGRQRIWTYSYHPTYNFVVREVDSRGNVPGVNPRLYATDYTYDKDNGNLLSIARPRATRAVVAADGSSQWRNSHDESFNYNSYNQVIWHQDAHGVITEYFYYSLTSAISGGVNAAGGGFLAKRTRDTTHNNVRQDNLPGIALCPINHQWGHDALGHVNTITDNAGNVTNMQTNDLHEMVNISFPSGATINGLATAQPPLIKQLFGYNTRAQLVQRKLHQPGATADSGGEYPFHEIWTDSYGNPTDAHGTVSLHPNAPIQTRHEKFDHNGNDVLTGYYSADVQAAYTGSVPSTLPVTAGSASADQGGVQVGLDERGMPSSMLFGVAPGSGASSGTGTTSALLKISSSWTTDGGLLNSMPPGAQSSFDYFADDFGATYCCVDPHGNVAHAIFDDGAMATRSLIQHGEANANQSRSVSPAFSDAPTLAFSEVKVDELGIVRRVHRATFQPDLPGAPSGSSGLAAPAEYFPAPSGTGSTSWPPPAGTLIDTGGWGPGDGRSTSDRVLDGHHLAVRTVNDQQGVIALRRDPHGRPLDVFIQGGGDPSQTGVLRKATYSYDAAGNPVEAVSVDAPSDAALSSQTFRTKSDYDAARRLVRSIDGEGNAHRVEYDQMSHVYVSYDAMGADSAETYNGYLVNSDGNQTTYSRDARGRVTKVEITLTLDGTGATASAGTVSATTQYSGDGRIVAFTDHEKNTTKWGYDSYGRLQSVNYTTAPSLGGPTSWTREYAPNTGRLQHTTDANGTVIEYTFDDLGRITRMKAIKFAANVGGTTGYSWTYNGSHTVITDLSTGRVVEQVMDSLGRMAQDIQDGVVVQRQHDGTGNVTVLSHPSGHGDVSYLRDTTGRLRKVLDRGQEIARFDYLGPHRETRRLQGPVTTTYSYSPGAGRFVGMRVDGLTFPLAVRPPSVVIVAPAGGAPVAPVVLRYVLYDLQSNPASIAVSFSTDGGKTFASADEPSGVASEGVSGLATSPAGSLHLFAWDAASDLAGSTPGNVLLRVQIAGVTAGGNATSRPFTIGPAASNLPPGIAMAPPEPLGAPAPLPLHYSAFDQESDPVGVKVTFSVNGGATFSAATEFPGAGSDGVSNLASSPLGTTHVFVWDLVKDMKGRPANGVLIRIAVFDSQTGGVDTIALFEAGATGSIQYQIERDRMNRLTRRTRLANGAGDVRGWSYDSAGRIVTATHLTGLSRSQGALVTTRQFDGDTVLRRETSDTLGGLPRTIQQDREERGRISARNGASLMYDKNGNMVDDGDRQYTYDAWNRLVSVAVGGHTVAYAYDPMGRRISRSLNGAIETFVYSSWHLIEVYRGGALSERYVYGEQSDEIISIETGGNRQTLLYTPEGFVDGLVDSQGTILERYDYDLNGKVTILNPAGVSQPGASIPQSRFQFQRRPYDPVAASYDYRFRVYQPANGVFLTPDPAGISSGANHYNLSHGDPINYADRFGMQDAPAWGSPEEKAKRGTAADERNILKRTWDAFTDWDGIKKQFFGEQAKVAAIEGVAKPTIDAFLIEFGGRFFGGADAAFEGLPAVERFVGRASLGATEGASFFSVKTLSNYLLTGETPTTGEAVTAIAGSAIMRPILGFVTDKLFPVKPLFQQSEVPVTSPPANSETLHPLPNLEIPHLKLDAPGLVQSAREEAELSRTLPGKEGNISRGRTTGVIRELSPHMQAGDTPGISSMKSLSVLTDTTDEIQLINKARRMPWWKSWNGACFEPLSASNMIRQGQALRGGVSVAVDVETGAIKDPCANCELLLRHLRIGWINKQSELVLPLVFPSLGPWW